MPKKYIVRLSEAERSELRTVVKKLSGSSQKVRRAQILLKADASGSNWDRKSTRLNSSHANISYAVFCLKKKKKKEK